MNELIINVRSTEKRFALKEAGVVTTIFVQQPKHVSDVGNIYIGKVANVKQGMNVAFVDIGTGKNGFLQRRELPNYLHCTHENKHLLPMTKYISVGDQLLVQVKKDATETKGPLLSAIIEIPGEHLVYMPEGKYVAVSKRGNEQERRNWRQFASDQCEGREGLIVRTEAFAQDEQQFITELNELRKVFTRLQAEFTEQKGPALLVETSHFYEELRRELSRLKSGTVYCDDLAFMNQMKEEAMAENWKFQLHHQKENIFTVHTINAELTKALKQIVWLKGGAYIVINETEAAVVIDVNTGKYTGKQTATNTVVQTNLLAAKEIVRQLRLRDYGGMILIDFIEMKSVKDRMKVHNFLAQELSKDPKQTRIFGFTPLGIFELTRKRTKQSLPATLQVNCPTCTGTGKVTSSETMAFRLERELWEYSGTYEAALIECDEQTMRIFKGKKNRHLMRLEEKLHLKLFFQPLSSNQYEYHIRQLGTVEEISKKQ